MQRQHHLIETDQAPLPLPRDLRLEQAIAVPRPGRAEQARQATRPNGAVQIAMWSRSVPTQGTRGKAA